MEFGVQTWLIIIGLIIIGGILFDGWRKMGKNKLKFDLNKQADDDATNVESEILGEPRVVKNKAEPQLGDLHDMRANEPVIGSEEEFHVAAEDKPQRLLETPVVAPQPQPAPQSKPAPAEPLAATKTAAAPSEVLVIIVLARSPLGFKGTELLQSILSSGLRYGDMDIFHRYTNMTGHGDTLFSMANAVAPGTFDLENINDFKTPAVSFFMQLPGPIAPTEAFELMLEAATNLARDLGGDLKDDQASVLTTQTVEHYRQRIANFEFKQRQIKNRLNTLE